MKWENAVNLRQRHGHLCPRLDVSVIRCVVPTTNLRVLSSIGWHQRFWRSKCSGDVPSQLQRIGWVYIGKPEHQQRWRLRRHGQFN